MTTPAPAPAPLVMLRGLAGAVIGGALGYFLFGWLRARGVYAHAVPGALIGVGAGMLAGGRSSALGVLSALAAVALTLIAEWIRAPFRDDPSLAFFLTHLPKLDHASIKLVLTGIGAVCAYWFGQGR